MLIAESSTLVPMSVSPGEHKSLFPRKGGGGTGGGHSSGKGGKSGSKGGSRASDVAKAHGVSKEFLDSRGIISVKVPGTGTSAMAYASGGGKPVVLKSDSAFSGRESGGGSRSTIFGTSHFGGGYPYGGHGSFVNSRPFPYHFYPVPVSYGYYGGDEYLKVNSTKRPGGGLVTAIIRPLSKSSGIVFRLVGDNSSVTAVFDALVANCSVTNSSSAITAFSPSTTTWPLPEQIVQYYRASSFALSFDSYNNTATLLANAPSSNDSSLPQIPDTLLPSGLNMTFLECVNSTIGSSVPLADVKSEPLSAGKIVGIVFGALAGVALLLTVLHYCCRGSSKASKRSRGTSY